MEAKAETWWRTIPPSTPTWTRICSTSCRWRAVVVGEFAGDTVDSRNRGRFQRSLPRPGRSRENSFSVDGQPITDQQSKVFSNQIPLDAVQSMEVISGAPPAEYGDKTSVVINVTTRSGQGVTTPHGSVTASYGKFRNLQCRLQSRLRRQEVGKFHFRQRAEQRAISRSAGVRRHARQGQ